MKKGALETEERSYGQCSVVHLMCEGERDRRTRTTREFAYCSLPYTGLLLPSLLFELVRVKRVDCLVAFSARFAGIGSCLCDFFAGLILCCGDLGG